MKRAKRPAEAFTVHRRSAIPFSSSEHPLSFHRSELRSKVRAMTATSRTGEKISSNRLAACAAHGCNRPFAVCGGCDRGRKFCSRVCANSARRESLRRAGRQYQATARGRSLHATRQARYRDRQRAVTHQSRVAEPNFLENSPKYGSVVASTTGASPGLCVPPRCAFCRQSGSPVSFFGTDSSIGHHAETANGAPRGTCVYSMVTRFAQPAPGPSRR